MGLANQCSLFSVASLTLSEELISIAETARPNAKIGALSMGKIADARLIYIVQLNISLRILSDHTTNEQHTILALCDFGVRWPIHSTNELKERR